MSSRPLLPGTYGDSRDDDEAADDHSPLLGERPSPVEKKNSRLLLFAGPALLLRQEHHHATLLFSFVANTYAAILFARWISLM